MIGKKITFKSGRFGEGDGVIKDKVQIENESGSIVDKYLVKADNGHIRTVPPNEIKRIHDNKQIFDSDISFPCEWEIQRIECSYFEDDIKKIYVWEPMDLKAKS